MRKNFTFWSFVEKNGTGNIENQSQKIHKSRDSTKDESEKNTLNGKLNMQGNEKNTNFIFRKIEDYDPKNNA